MCAAACSSRAKIAAKSKRRLKRGQLRTVTPNLRQLPDRIRDTKNGVPVLDHTLDYDENGNLAALVDGLPGGLESRTLSYDGRNRLIGVSGAPTGNETYVYDPLDRLRQRVQAGVDRRFHYHSATTRLSHLVLPSGLAERAYEWNERGELIGKRTPAAGPDDLMQSGFEDGEFGVPSQAQGYVFDAARPQSLLSSRPRSTPPTATTPSASSTARQSRRHCRRSSTSA